MKKLIFLRNSFTLQQLSLSNSFVFLLKNKTTTSSPSSQPKQPSKQDDNERIMNPTTTKTSDTSSRDDAYYMIPIDRKESNRQEIEQITNKDADDDQQSKSGNINFKKENEGKITTSTNQEMSSEDMSKAKQSVDKNIPVLNTTPANDE